MASFKKIGFKQKEKFPLKAIAYTKFTPSKSSGLQIYI